VFCNALLLRKESPLSLKDILNIPEENRELWEPLIEDHRIRVINVAEQDEEISAPLDK
jgi:hypothetical protein